MVSYYFWKIPDYCFFIYFYFPVYSSTTPIVYYTIWYFLWLLDMLFCCLLFVSFVFSFFPLSNFWTYL